MIIIKNEDDFRRLSDLPIADAMKGLIVERLALLDSDMPMSTQASFLVVQSGDRLADLEREMHFSIGDPPQWEWVIDHGTFYEAVISLSDDGYGIVLLVEKNEDESSIEMFC